MDPTGGKFIFQLEAKNQDATEYRWLVNGKPLADKTFKPPAFTIPAGAAANQATVELTISYTINDSISEDSSKKLVGPNTPANAKNIQKI